MASALIAQGGGPTPVMNATLVAAIRQVREVGRTIPRFLGSAYGLRGIMHDQVYDLLKQDRAVLDGLVEAPGAALGSSREKLSEQDMELLLEAFKRHDVRWFFYNGGNGSMGTALDIEQYARAASYELQVIGVPKTVDNDLMETDHTPGYGSAARFWAHAVRDMGLDHLALPSPVLICEVIGRNVGWIAAATAFARCYPEDAPHLIYCPERPLPRGKLLADIEGVYRRLGRAFVCICEGQLDENGEAFGADVDRPDHPQHRLASNLGHAVGKFVSKELRLRVRSERPSLLGRSSSAFVSEVDRREAELCGREAVRAAIRGETGKMVALQRGGGKRYACVATLEPLEKVARRERRMPPEFLAESGRDVTTEFLEYADPLVGDVRCFPRLR